jgi:Zn-dependent protease
VAKASTAGAPDLPSKLYAAGGPHVLIGSLSVSIGFMNLLPIPVLDGGHLLMYAYEAIAKRPLRADFQAAGFRAGLALILGFMLFAAWNDLQPLRRVQIHRRPVHVNARSSSMIGPMNNLRAHSAAFATGVALLFGSTALVRRRPLSPRPRSRAWCSAS